MQSTPEIDVAIIGGGLAGLTAALTARDAGARVVVLEAGSRIGGRIRSVLDDTGHPLADLGPTWVWPPYQPVVARWLERLGLDTFAQFNTGNAILEGFGPQQQQMPLPGQHGMVRIAGGPGALVKAIAERLPANAIRIDSPVAAIRTGKNGLTISVENDRPALAASRVILSAPLRVAAQRISLPDLPDAILQIMRETPTWMASQIKVAILYDQAFWKTRNLSGRVASQHGPMFEVHDHSSHDGKPALFGFASRADIGGPDALRDAILTQLVRCLGPQAGQPQDLVIQDWGQERYIASDADRAGAQPHPEIGPDILRSPQLQGRLFLAVSEVSDVSPGLIEGALRAGELAGKFATRG